MGLDAVLGGMVISLMTQTRVLLPFTAFACLSVALSGCAESTAPEVTTEALQPAAATEPAPMTEPADSGDSAVSDAGGGAGSMTLTIGEEVWEFDNLLCVTGLEANESDLFSFVGYSIGQAADGARIEFFAELADPSGEGRLEGDGVEALIELILYGGAELATVYSAQTDLGWDDNTAVVTVDGGTVTGSGDFVAEEDYGFGADTTEGGFTGTCGDESLG